MHSQQVDSMSTKLQGNNALEGEKKNPPKYADQKQTATMKGEMSMSCYESKPWQTDMPIPGANGHYEGRKRRFFYDCKGEDI